MSIHPPINTIQQPKLSLVMENNKKLLKMSSKQPEIRIVYFGTPYFSAYVLEQLIQFTQTPPSESLSNPQGPILKPPQFIIQAVVTQADKPVGRKQIVTPSPVTLVAQKYQIPTLKPQKIDEQFLKSHLSFLDADLFIVVAYGKILPQKLLNIPTLGAINLHGSLLPKYRGASPIQAAILNKEEKTGVSIMLMDAQLDHGPILTTREIRLSPKDTYESLSNKMMIDGADLLIETLPKFVQGKLIPKEQNHERANFCKMIEKEDGYFDLNNPPSPEILDRMIRAYYPWPTAWTRWEGKIVKFLPGGLIQLEGKKPMKLQDFLHGHPNFPPQTVVITS